jgi:hypothetical protein
MKAPVLKRKICMLYCKQNIVNICRRRKNRDPCAIYINHIKQQQHEKELGLQHKSESQWEKQKAREELGHDAFDRNAYDETDKNISESLYDEKMDVLLE